MVRTRHHRKTPWLWAAAFCVVTAAAPLASTAQSTPLVEPSYATALIRDALIAVNQANWTGNYTVLRDYASPGFHDAHDATALAALMLNIRAERLDLLQVLSVDPVILETQLSPDQTMMQLTGYFPLEPRHVSFDLAFLRDGSRWLLHGVSVGAFAPILEAN